MHYFDLTQLTPAAETSSPSYSGKLLRKKIKSNSAHQWPWFFIALTFTFFGKSSATVVHVQRRTRKARIVLQLSRGCAQNWRKRRSAFRSSCSCGMPSSRKLISHMRQWTHICWGSCWLPEQSQAGPGSEWLKTQIMLLNFAILTDIRVLVHRRPIHCSSFGEKPVKRKQMQPVFTSPSVEVLWVAIDNSKHHPWL